MAFPLKKFVRVKVPGDGSCFYHAVAVSLRMLGHLGRAVDGVALRGNVATSISMIPFLRRAAPKFDTEGGGALVRRIRDADEWATDDEAMLLSHFYGLTLRVLLTYGPYAPVWQEITPDTIIPAPPNRKRRTVYLINLGSDDGGGVHFDALVPRRVAARFVRDRNADGEETPDFLLAALEDGRWWEDLGIRPSQVTGPYEEGDKDPAPARRRPQSSRRSTSSF